MGRQTGKLADAAVLHEAAARASIDALRTDGRVTAADDATVHLAISYAALIDECDRDEDRKLAAWAHRWIGPLLLDCLEALGATPRARQRGKTGGDKPHAAPASKLGQLRAARAKAAK